ncbi:hypothetical protein OAG71_04200, partial [bacterium]|nr:hypothetical protein [bacterium]
VATGGINRTIAIETIPNFKDGGLRLSNDGTKLAGFLYGSSTNVRPHGNRFAVWDAQTGKLQTQFLAPEDARLGCTWLDEDIVLARGYLFSISKQKTLGKLDYSGGDFEYSPPKSTRPVKISSRISKFSRTLPLRVSVTSNLPTSTMRTICRFLEEDAMKAIRALDPEPEIIFKKGDAMHVSVKGVYQATVPGFGEQVEATLKDVMDGYEKVKTSKNRLVVSVAEKEAGIENYGLKTNVPQTTAPKGKAVRIKDATISFDLYVGDRLIHKLQTGGRTLDEVVVKSGENYVDKLSQSHWTEALRALRRFDFKLLPEYQVFDNLETVKFAPHVADRDWLIKQAEGKRLKTQNKVDRERLEYSASSPYAVRMPPSKQFPEPVWDVKLFSLPELSSRIMRRPMRLFPTDSFENVGKLTTSQFGDPQLIVTYFNKKSETMMARFALKTGKLKSSVVLSRRSQFVTDLRPDGKYFVTSSQSGMPSQGLDDVRLWKASEGKKDSDAVVTTFTLPRPVKRSRNSRPDIGAEISRPTEVAGPIQAAFLTGKDRVLLVGTDCVICRSFDDPEPIYSLTIKGTIGVSPGRQYFVALHEGAMKIFKASDGSVAGALKGLANYARDDVRLDSASFRSDGKQLLINVQGLTSISDMESRELLSNCINYGSGVGAWKDDWRFYRPAVSVTQASTGAVVWKFEKTNREGRGSSILSAGGEDLYYVEKDDKWVSLNRWPMTSKPLQKAFDRYIKSADLLADKKVAIRVAVEKFNWDPGEFESWSGLDDFQHRIEEKLSSHLVPN